ncbi:MAG TPA: ABC transporter ATP-binding protein [Marmoricola sp.]|nr:ABC transporter ATP-binding protein [Marmoricola sp.]
MSGLVLREVSVRFGDLLAVDHVSLGVAPGEVLAVLGPSGCGKSSLLRAIAGLEPIASGSISYDDVDLARVPAHKRGFSMLFQDGQLFAHFDVAGNIAYPLRLRHWNRSRIAARVAELLELVDLVGYEERRPGTLSGGEQQRVALARALAAHPRMVLLDEPLSALDRELRERLAVDLRHILTASDTSAMLVTHDQEEAFAVADHMAVMRSGRIISQGTLAQVWGKPPDAWAARFLGYAAVLDQGQMAAVGVRHPGHLLAIRRSALTVDPAGTVVGVVESVAATPDVVRLLVAIPGAGVVPAVAAVGTQLQIGGRVRLSLDETKMAPIKCEDLGSAP